MTKTIDQKAIVAVAKADNWYRRGEHGALIMIAVGLKQIDRISEAIELFGNHGGTGSNGALATFLNNGMGKALKRIRRKAAESTDRVPSDGGYSAWRLIPVTQRRELVELLRQTPFPWQDVCNQWADAQKLPRHRVKGVAWHCTLFGFDSVFPESK